MNNKLKFRVWNKKSQSWDHDIVIFGHGGFGKLIEEKFGIYRLSTEGKRDIEITCHTGLKDKDGKLIFDGDIIKIDGGKRTFLVHWQDSGWWPFNLTKEYCQDIYGFRFVEIVGNKYENPELLNKKEIA